MKKTLIAILAVAAMLAVLVGVGAYYWMADTPRQNDPSGVGDARGNQIGDRCYGYDLPIVTGDGVTAQTIDPSATGTITVLNFWGTWCTPCVNELPYFDRIASEYGETVTVIAAHGMNTPTAPAFIGQYYPDTAIIFANDYAADPANPLKEDGYYTTLGGRGTYPYTLVLDKDGVITEIFYSSVTYEMLKEAVDSALS